MQDAQTRVSLFIVVSLMVVSRQSLTEKSYMSRFFHPPWSSSFNIYSHELSLIYNRDAIWGTRDYTAHDVDNFGLAGSSAARKSALASIILEELRKWCSCRSPRRASVVSERSWVADKRTPSNTDADRPGGRVSYSGDYSLRQKNVKWPN